MKSKVQSSKSKVIELREGSQFCHASRITHHSSQGVALVITLILLSVITFMAITFLVVSRGEKSTVGSITEQTTARLAAEAGLEIASDAIIAPGLAFTNNLISPRLIVSTNYINALGFNTAGNLRGYLTNVSYTYGNGQPLTANDGIQNIANLFYLPRVPVFVTNRFTGRMEFNYYYDLNRNGRFEDSGWIPQTNALGQPIITGTNTIATNFAMGDPQWIGILERGNYTPAQYNPKFPSTKNPIFPVGLAHSADNLFISRYAYVVIPASAALDINYMHNYAKGPLLGSVAMAADGLWRNQGVGSWEINLAAFLADLNTNFWNNSISPYVYDRNFPQFQANRGTAFDDAVSLLRFRYARSYLPPRPDGNGKLPDVQQNFGNLGVFRNDFVDMYSSGQMTGPWWTPATTPVDSDGPFITRVGWWGSDNPSNYFDMQELFDRSKIVPADPTIQIRFSDRLLMASTNTSTYDRYTFYRLLEQLGTDSAPESPKLNLNYVDVDASGNIQPNLATNFIPWQPVQFFTNAAARMLADAGYGTNIVENVGGVPRIHIQIFPTNYYSPSVHRYLQLAANIYDASTNRAFIVPDATNGFPSVFRPIFFDEGVSISNRVWIIGYSEVTNIDVRLVSTNLGQLTPFHDLNEPTDKRPVKANDMVYGIPLLIGAKKGFPNFNEFGLLQDMNVARNLIFHRVGGTFNTNQIFTMGISNALAIEAWNSYSTAYPRPLEIVAVADVITKVTNEFGQICRDQNNNLLSTTSSFPVITNIVAAAWKGFTSPQSRQSFVFPLGTRAYLFLTNSDYSFNQNRFVPAGSIPTDPQNQFPVPRWKVMLRPRVRFALLDLTANRIIDYVNISEQQDPVDVAQLLQGNDNGGDATCNGNFNGEMGSFFCTNRAGGSLLPNVATYGILNQFGVSIGSIQVSDAYWRSFNPQEPDRQPAIDKFRNRILGADTTTDFAAPFVPRRVIHQSISWQANDPLVHYVAGDLQDPLSGKRKISYEVNGLGGIAPNADPLVGMPTLAGAGVGPALNQHYRPWGGNPNKVGETSPKPTNKRLELKDSMIKVSDNWSFVTNKFPNVGWLGRVHRGTPWQTLFLKSTNVDFESWTNWVGNNYVLMNYDDRGSSNYDSIFSLPTNDFRVLDLFTTAINENASKGQLSVNQTNLAAWSAVLSGVIVNTNGTTNGFTWIEPAGVYDAFGPSNALPPLVKIVNGINRTRSGNGTNVSGGLFQGRGDILNVPELTVNSPYLQGANPDNTPDWVYERIPQQVMSLLRGGDEPPRFVVYAFGQALKPAEHSLVTASGSFFGLCTNYQVTAESVIRAVVRVDNAPTSRQPNNVPRVTVESFNVLPPY